MCHSNKCLRHDMESISPEKTPWYTWCGHVQLSLLQTSRWSNKNCAVMTYLPDFFSPLFSKPDVPEPNSKFTQLPHATDGSHTLCHQHAERLHRWRIFCRCFDEVVSPFGGRVGFRFLLFFAPLCKHPPDGRAKTTKRATAMVRLVPFVATMLTFGITAGAPLPFNPEGEWTRLPVPERTRHVRAVVKPSSIYDAYVLWEKLMHFTDVKGTFHCRFASRKQPTSRSDSNYFRPLSTRPKPVNRRFQERISWFRRAAYTKTVRRLYSEQVRPAESQTRRKNKCMISACQCLQHPPLHLLSLFYHVCCSKCNDYHLLLLLSWNHHALCNCRRARGSFGWTSLVEPSPRLSVKSYPQFASWGGRRTEHPREARHYLPQGMRQHALLLQLYFLCIAACAILFTQKINTARRHGLGGHSSSCNTTHVDNISDQFYSGQKIKDATIRRAIERSAPYGVWEDYYTFLSSIICR